MPKFSSSADDIISKLSFTHLREIMSIDDPLVRYFYEQECMRCTWSVRELRRQIGTNLHIRVGLSKDPEKCLSPYKNGSDSTPTADQRALHLRIPWIEAAGCCDGIRP